MTGYDRVFCQRVGIKPYRVEKASIIWERVVGFSLIFGILSGAWVLIAFVVRGALTLVELIGGIL